MWKLDMHHDFNRCDSSETGSSPKTSPVTNQQRNRQTIWKITPMFHNAATGQLVQMWERGPWKPELGCERWGEVKKTKQKSATLSGAVAEICGEFFLGKFGLFPEKVLLQLHLPQLLNQIRFWVIVLSTASTAVLGGKPDWKHTQPERKNIFKVVEELWHLWEVMKISSHGAVGYFSLFLQSHLWRDPVLF